MKSIRIVFLLLGHFILTCAMDPCKNAKFLPDATQRFVSNRLVGDIYPPIDDSALTNGWYRVDNEDIPTTEPPDIERCGTVNPVFIRGNLPTVKGETKTVDVLYKHSKTESKTFPFKIEVHRCDGFNVYNLKGTQRSYSAYCFGLGEEAEIPIYTISKAEVQIFGIRENDSPKIKAKCKFNKLTGGSVEKLMYEVFWYVGKRRLPPAKPDYYQFVERTDILLDDIDGFTMGQNISCKVTTTYAIKGPRGKATSSENRFIGFQILTPVITLKDNLKSDIVVRQTAPFICTVGQSEYCDLPLTLIKTSCEGVVSTSSSTNCNKKIQQSKMGEFGFEDHNITIRSFTKVRQRTEMTVGVLLEVTDQPYHEIWSNYRLPPVKVYINPSDHTEWFGRSCILVNDPHITTFDNWSYDIHFGGEFLLYRNTKHPNLQVHGRFEACYNNNQRPYCICGVAIQSGGDVFVVHRCRDNKYENVMRFTRCDDGFLDVRKPKNSSLQYRVQLPIGTIVDLDVSGKHITIHIYPYEKDFEKVEGLCGNYNDNCIDDLSRPNGTSVEDPTCNTKKCKPIKDGNPIFHEFSCNPDKFSASWRVNSSLFAVNEDTVLESFTRDHLICQCSDTQPHEADDSLKPNNPERYKIDCSPYEKANCNADKKVEYTPYCRISARRRKRSTLSWPFNRPSEYSEFRRKRSTSSGDVLMTREQARHYCLTEMQKSKSFQLCSTVPNVNPTGSIETCITDIMISKSTAWTSSAREALKSQCTNELGVNTTLQEPTGHGQISLAEMITEINCPNECSGAGTCSNGTCLCNDGFGLSDCSIDLSIPPDFYSLMGGGLCDKQEFSCDEAMINGDDFADEAHTTCQIKPVEMDMDGNLTISADELKIKADVQTLMSLNCKLPSLRERRSIPPGKMNSSFINGFSIALSNDGFHFGGEHIFFIFDSLCQEPGIINGQQGFLLKRGYCFIDGSCFQKSEVNPTENCMECNPAMSVTRWAIKTRNECASQKVNYLWTIGVVLGAIALLIAIVTAWKIRIKLMQRKVSDSTSNLTPYLQKNERMK